PRAGGAGRSLLRGDLVAVGAALLIAAQVVDRVLEVLGGGESPVYRGETQVGDLVEVAQRRERGQADLVARDLRGTGGAHRLFDLLRQQVQRVLVHVQPTEGRTDSAHHLGAAEGLFHSGTLDHREHRGLHGGEPLAAFGARAPTPDGLTLIRFP